MKAKNHRYRFTKEGRIVILAVALMVAFHGNLKRIDAAFSAAD